jgi:GNAT superfamily N-acetyltransferase
MLIRDYRDEDWPEIYRFFSEIVATGETYAYPDHLASEDARRVWVLGPPGRTVVAVENSHVIASAHMGPNRPGRGSHVATASFMVAPSRQRRGIGRALGHHVVDWATSAGYVGIQFNAVVETNLGAVELWHSLGFEILGTVPAAFDHPDRGLVGLHLMFKRLRPGR